MFSQDGSLSLKSTRGLKNSPCSRNRLRTQQRLHGRKQNNAFTSNVHICGTRYHSQRNGMIGFWFCLTTGSIPTGDLVVLLYGGSFSKKQNLTSSAVVTMLAYQNTKYTRNIWRYAVPGSS